MKKVWWLAIIAALVVSSAAVGILFADSAAARFKATVNGPAPGMVVPDQMPPVNKGAMFIENDDAVSQLFFDDGTCEAQVGIAIPNTALVDFDVPTQCTQAGLSVIGVNAHVPYRSATAFTLRQSGASPGIPASGIRVPFASPLTGGSTGCFGQTTTGAFRAVSPAAVVAGTANFFGGVVMGSVGGWIGRDTSSSPALRNWLNCAGCSGTVYTPTQLQGLGLGGNWILRVTVEDANCVPVELMSFGVE
jgi:hypothetical protein